ncbi:MAG: hypothetical protein FDZ70_06960 [Actinobacteria bacterium]|nr:MAG: hypothetical protein FDZ70_06960 [Actinomycetota bacterium]
MIVQVTRFLSFLAGALGGFTVSQAVDWTEQTSYSPYYVLFILVVLGGSVGFILGGIIGREVEAVFRRLEERVREIAAVDLLLGIVGLLVGLIVAVFLSLPLRYIQPQSLAVGVILLISGLCAWAGMRLALVRRADAAHAFPRLAGGSGAAAGAPRKFLDTSAVIDGRFAEMRRAGFLEGELLVPGFVVAELQTLADSADDVRRARGRRGLDLLQTMREGDLRVEVFEADYSQIGDVDHKLERLAIDSGGTLVTVDYNLTGAARVKGVTVLNVNEMAAALRPAHLPGENIRLRIIREGKEPEQGVGYLEDGTMVVVHGGVEHVGAEVDTEVTSVLQTSTGRMIFARFKAVV